MSKTAAEFLVKALEKIGVEGIYGVVGDSLNDTKQLVDLAKVRLSPASRGLAANSGRRVGHLVQAREDPN
jgi:hypothetical protein